MTPTIDRGRFKDAPWFPKHEEKCMIGGAGGIGSWLTLFLSRAGFNPIVFDFDRLEEHNLGGQLYTVRDIGKLKVDALAIMCKTFSDKTISIFNKKIDLSSPTHYFCFSAFDNMLARREMFDVWKRSFSQSVIMPLFIDGRLTAEQIQIFCVTPANIERYEEHLFDDSLVEDAPCTFKQTSHCAAMIAAHMTAFFTNHITNIYEGQIVRDVPFYYEHFIPVTLTNVES